jgi:hypothetical protein
MTEIAAMLRSLELARADAVPDLSLLEATYAADSVSTPFWSLVLDDAGMNDGRLKSRPGRRIELYQDAIARHSSSGAIALSLLDSRGEFQHLSFAELDAAATACASAWSLAGLEQGDVLAIALPMGVNWLVAFAAALRLGLTISCLGSFGEHALSHRLGALDPKAVVFDPAGPALPAEFAERALAVVRFSAGHALPVRAYAPEQAFGKLFSPLRAPLQKPVAVAAEVALLWGLRDARFAYRLEPGAGLAMPGLPFEQHLPAVILATLLVGARFVELPVSAILRAPALLAQPFITTLGVSPALRDACRRAPVGALPALRGWWRSVDDALDWSAWQDFVAKSSLARVPVSNLLVDAASGGALLTSVRRPGLVNAFVVPSPGVPYGLFDVGSGAPSRGVAGVFSAGVESDPKNPGWFLLARRASELLYGGTLSPRRAGRVFPEREVVECVSRILGVDGACVVPVAAGEPGPRWDFVLVVFAAGLTERARQALPSLVESALRAQLGADFLPDRVLVSPLDARRKSQKLDLDWCRRQYSAGFLERKARLPLFGRLSALRAALRRDEDDVR